ncbi:unnamed protein product [Vicia faba]|uniref:CCHC-type domain-containing protein n=2 Tax=Vicia faba TaxID=3906 RepID=A0AAV0ZH16_VICFA|nr:unnamed protein product [Vicia faba]
MCVNSVDLSFVNLLGYKRRPLVIFQVISNKNKNHLVCLRTKCSNSLFFLPKSFSYCIHVIIPHIDASMLYTCLNTRILCIRKHLTIDPYYGPHYYGMSVLIVSLCYAYGWLFNDDTVKTGFIVCEAPGQCGIRASTERRGAYGMNIINIVSKGEKYLTMALSQQNTHPITTTSSLSLPKLCKKTDTHKIENLVGYSYVPEDAQISETVPPLLSPYNIFKKQRTITRSIRNLISTNRPQMKEYVQSSRLDQCSLRATNQEQYVDLEIPQSLINHWKSEGYTALHFGAVRLILSLHGRKNQPVFCKIALLDSSYLHYENVVIGTVLTSLHAGSVVLTVFPNYNVSLNDSTLSTRLKVQVQITGSDQVPEAMSATLHHQIIYRLQNHSIDLPLTGCSSDSLLVVTNREEDIPSIVQIPRKITREELTQLVPLEWITNYEKIHQDRRQIQSQEATFRRSVDKTVKTIFKKTDEGPSSIPPIFQTMMIRPILKEDWCPIHAVTSKGEPIYTDKINGHFIWDVDPNKCDPGCECWMHDNDYDRDIILPKRKNNGACKPSPPPQRRYDPDNGPWVGIHDKKKPLPIYEEALKILRKEKLLPPNDPTLVTWSPSDHCKVLDPPKNVELIPCFMYSTTAPEYSQQFPALERKMDPITGRTSKPFIHPNEVQPDGKLKPLTQAEEVLNWQSENMISQNDILQNLDKKVDKIAERIDETDDYLKVLSQKMQKHYRSLKAQVSQLDRDLRQMLEERTFGKNFDQKEREIRNLQGQVKEIDDFLRASHERKPKPVENLFLDPPTFPTYFKRPERPSPFFPTYVTSPPDQNLRIFLKHLLQNSKKEEEIPDKGFQAMAITGNCEFPQKSYSLAESSAQKEDESSSDDEKDSCQETSSDETPRSFSSESQSEVNYIPRLFMANIKEEDSFFEESPEETLVPERTKPNGGPWFTFDDIPPSRWRKRLLEFGAWLDTQMMKTNADSYKVIEEFCCRMTGTMKEWYHNLGAFKQDELHRLESTANILGVLHQEFIGDMDMFDRKNRQEFFEMKCCSLKTKDLDKHYHRMAQRFYLLNGYNDPSLKNTYVSSLPHELQQEIHRMVATAKKDIATMSLGQIHQATLEALEKLCSFHHQFQEVIQQKSKFTKACKKPYLEIKCKDKKCSCETKNKHHHQKYSKSHKNFKGKKKKTMKFFKRKSFRGKGKNRRCFICGKKGHFSKECPNNTHKASKLINSLQSYYHHLFPITS